MVTQDKRKLPKALGPFVFWGVEFNDSADGEFIATCPFCLHNDTRSGQGHLFVNAKTGAFDCKSCGKQGGRSDFIKFIHAKYLVNTSETQIQSLADQRGIPRIALEGWQIAAADGGRFLIPVYDSENKMVDLRVYRKGKNEIATKGCGTELLGIKRTYNNSKRSEPIYICAGSFDCIYLDWLLKRTGKRGITLATPGENTWKDHWITAFEKRDVVICYDHDESGYGSLDENTGKSTGSLKVYSRLKHVASSIQFLCWPDKFPEKFDVSDLINKRRKEDISPKKIYSEFKSFIKFQHKFHNRTDKAPSTNGKPAPPVTSWHDLREKYASLFEINDNFETAIKLSLATVISTQFSGSDPVWLLLVGPGGEGKSVIIESIEASLKVLWESSLSSKALCSGWGLGQTRVDPSILARVDGKCLALKDYTEVLEKNETEKNEIFSILRGAFDGRLKRPFGTGVREYVCKFTMLAGVTNKIEAYSQGSVGERFLRYGINPVSDNEAKQEAALNMQYTKDEKMPLLKEAVSSFLDQDFDLSPERCQALLPSWWRDRVKPLGRLVEWMRTQVERQAFGVRKDTVIYQPVAGSGNRASTQLEKIGTALCLLEGKPLIDEAIYDIVKQVAKDSVRSYITNVGWSIIRCKNGIGKGQLEKIHKVTFIQNYIDDLRLIGLVRDDTNPDLCVPSKKAHDLYLRAKLNVQ